MNDTAWRTRYEHVLHANERLQEQLEAVQAALRRARTHVKHEPSLPNNDAFTKQLVEEKRRLLARVRTLELRLARSSGVRGAPTSARALGVDKSRRTGLSVKHAGVQTDDQERTEAYGREEERGERVEKAPGSTPNAVVAGIVHELKERLKELELDVTRLREENELLRQEIEETRENDAVVGNRDDVQVFMREKQEQKELEHLLNDRIRQMNILETQFAHLQGKMKTQALLYKESLSKVEELTGELFEAKQMVLKQKEWLQVQEDRNLQLNILEKEVHALRSENMKLDDAIAVLSDKPLDLLSLQLDKRAIELKMLEDEKTRLQHVTEKLEQENKTLSRTNEKLRTKVKVLNGEMEGTYAELNDLKSKCERFASEREVASLQLQFHLSGEQDDRQEFMEAVGRALREMKLNERTKSSAEGVATLLHQAAPEQNEKLGTQRLSAERTRKAAELTQLLQQDYQAQLNDLRVAHQAEVRDLRHKWKRWERRANDYLRELHELQSAKLHGTAKRSWTPIQNEHTSRQGDDNAGNTNPLTKSLQSVMLRVHLHNLHFDSGRCNADGAASSFLLFCDYFDFESQYSPPFSAPENSLRCADLDMEVEFTVVVNQAFCQSPLAQACTVELHQVAFSCSDVIAVATVNLQSLFLSENGVMAMSAKLRHPISNANVGSIRLSCTLSYPIQALYRAWFPKKPTADYLLIPKLTNWQADMNVTISIAAAVIHEDVVPPGGKVRVSYRFMGHPSVAYSRTPLEGPSFGYRFLGFERHRVYDIPSDEAFLKHLQRYELGVSLMIITSNRQSNNSYGVITFGPVATLIREGGNDQSIITFATLRKDDAASERALGRVWVEISVGAIASSRGSILDASVVRGCVRRVFGVASTRINWRRLLLVLSLTPTERVVRQLIKEKCNGSALKMLHATLTSDPVGGTVASILQGYATDLTRSDMSFVCGALASQTVLIEADEQPPPNERVPEVVRAKLVLLIETMDLEWLQWEGSLRRRAVELNVFVEYAGDDNWIEWEVAVQRLRLV